MNIGWPEGIFLTLMFLTLCLYIGKHGQARGNYNAGFYLFDVGLMLSLLYWGGFFA